MDTIKSIVRIVLIILTGFLALTAFAGGIGLVANLNAPPVEQLEGAPFKSFVVPGLSLFVIVGGSALLATILLVRRSRFGTLFATVAGIIIMFFEFVEVLVIGSPPGIARTLQIFYYGLGTVIAVVAIGSWFLDLVVGPEGTRVGEAHP